MKQFSPGLNPAQFWSLNGVAGLALILMLISSWLFFANRSLQAEVAARQQYISETVQLGSLRTQMANFLANLAVRTDDRRIRELLNANGITIDEARAGELEPAVGGADE